MLSQQKRAGVLPRIRPLGPFFVAEVKIPRLSLKICPRARIYALYGRSVRAGA